MAKRGTSGNRSSGRPAGARPFFLSLRDDITAMILSGSYKDGEALPSVRKLAAEVKANPLTVARAYQGFIESGVVEMRRGVGLFVSTGGSERLRQFEKLRFLEEDWPSIRAEIRRLQLDELSLLEPALLKDES